MAPDLGGNPAANEDNARLYLVYILPSITQIDGNGKLQHLAPWVCAIVTYTV